MTEHGGAKNMVLHSARAYDALVWVLTRGKEGRFRESVLDLANLQTGESVVDVGCGTGSLAIAAKRRVGTGGDVRGFDASEEMIARAGKKARKAGVDAQFETGSIEALPVPDDSFDAVLSTLTLHHLTDEARRDGVREVARVLKPGGRFLAVDIGGKKGKRRGPFQRLPRHADFDLAEIVPSLSDAGLHILQRGPLEGPLPMGLGNLRFLVAESPLS